MEKSEVGKLGPKNLKVAGKREQEAKKKGLTVTAVREGPSHVPALGRRPIGHHKPVGPHYW